MNMLQDLDIPNHVRRCYVIILANILELLFHLGLAFLD